jgi:hypothetical protein
MRCGLFPSTETAVAEMARGYILRQDDAQDWKITRKMMQSWLGRR